MPGIGRNAVSALQPNAQVDHTSAADVREAEARRCRAVNVRDWATLRDLLDDRFVYHHWHGKTDDRDHWLAHLEEYASYRTERGSMHVDLYGDVAVVVGILRNVIVKQDSNSPSTSTISAIQIWTRTDGTWREAAHYSFKNSS
jgi:ketosteroid isomerase-like protein